MEGFMKRYVQADSPDRKWYFRQREYYVKPQTIQRITNSLLLALKKPKEYYRSYRQKDFKINCIPTN